MKKLTVAVVVCALVSLISGSVLALDIDVAPNVLVLKSKGGSFTVHTDFPFPAADEVSLDVNGSAIGVHIFSDDCGNLVAQCSKEAVKAVIDDFKGKTTTAAVTLTVNGESDTDTITVRK